MAFLLEELILNFSVDTDSLDRGLDSVSAKARARAKEIERMAIAPKVDLSGLHELNKLLDIKQRHIRETAQFAARNPIMIGVDYEDVTDAIKELKELKKEIKESKDNNVKVSGNSKGDRQTSNQSSETLFEEVEQKLTGEVKKAVNKIGDIVTAPFAGIGRGFFEGFGQSISKELSKGFMGNLDQQLNVNLKDYGKKAANATVDYLFPQMPDRRKYEAKAKEYQQTLKELNKITDDLIKSIGNENGFTKEKQSLSEVKSKAKEIKSSIKNSLSMGDGIPSKESVYEYSILVSKQIDELAILSSQISSTSEDIAKKAKIYKKLNKNVSTYQSQIDEAFNTEDYGLLRKVRKNIKNDIKNIKEVNGDEIIDNYRNQLLALQKSAKADTRAMAVTSDAPSVKDYLLHPVNSLSLMGHKKVAQVESAVEQMKDDIVHFAIESAKATVRGTLGAGKSTFKALQAAEDAWMDLAPANEARMGKAVIQRFLPSIALGVASTQFPLLGAGINAIAPVAGSIAGGIVHGGLGLAGHGAGMLANAVLPEAVMSGVGTVMNTAAPIAANIGKFAGFMGNMPGIHGIVEGAGAFGNAVGGLGSTLLVYLGGGRVVSAIVGKVVKEVDQSVTRAIAPSENPSKYLEAAKTSFKTWDDKYKNKDQYLALMPAQERPVLDKAVSVIGQAQEAYRGLFDSLKATGVNFDLTKIKSKKDVGKLGQDASQKVASWIETQYVVAQKALMDLEDSIANLPKDSKAFGSEISNAKAQLSKRASLLAEKAKFFGMRLSDVKIERNPHLESVAVSSVPVPDLTKIERTVGKTTKKVADIWGDTAIEVSASMVEMTETAKKQAYPLQKNLSEGSPGPTHWICKNWEKTATFVKKQIENITATSAKLFSQSANSSGRIAISQKITPDIVTVFNPNNENLRQKHWQSVASQKGVSPSDIGISSVQSGINQDNGLKARFANIQSRLLEVNHQTSEYQISIIKKDAYEISQEYEKLRSKLKERIVATFGTNLGNVLPTINKKYDNQIGKLKSEFGSITNTYKGNKSSIEQKYNSIKSKLDERMKRELDTALSRDEFIRQFKKEIEEKYTEREKALTILMLRSIEGKDGDKQTSIRQKFARKKQELLTQKSVDMGLYKEESPFVRQKYDILNAKLEQEKLKELQPINEKQKQQQSQYETEQNKLIQQKNKDVKRLRVYQKKMDQLNQDIKKINNVSEEIKQKTVEPLVTGSVDFYDNFLNSTKNAIAKQMGLRGKHGDHMMDQITTFVTAGASTFFPSLTPMIASAPLFMPLIPTMMATLGIGTLIAPIVGRIDQALRQQEPIKQRFTTLEGNPIAGDKKQQEIIDIASKYSIPVDSASANFSQMAIAARNTNLTATEMIDLFDGISASIKALGLNTQDADLIFMAYTQMLSKGKISMEELRQQLGERFPPAMSIFAKSLGVSTAALDEMVSRGAISTEQWVPKVTKILKEDFGNAALAAGDNYASAITRIENVNFKLNKNFSDTYGGLFAGVQVGFANLLDTFNKNFKILNALAISGLIAVGASISIGLTYILRTPAINNFVTGGTSILLSTFKFTLKALTPFLIGTLADVMDDVLGAKNNVFDNMSKGVGNFFTGIFTGVDQSIRNTSGMGLFDPFKENKNPFSEATKGLQELISKVPSGTIELTALVLMFEQVRVLGGMYIAPLFKDLAGGIANWGKAVKDAIGNRDTLMRTMGDLFGGTLTSLTGVDKNSTLEKYKKDFQELRVLAQDNPLANFGKTREAVIQSDMSKGLNRREIMANRKQEFDQLARVYGLQISESGKYLPDPNNDPLVKYHERRDELLKNKMRKEATSRALMFGAQIALEAGLALGIMSFAKGDFSNTIGSELNKTKTQMIASINSMNLALEKLRSVADKTADSFAKIKLPSKGAQLDIRSIWDETKDFKWDDLVEKINKGMKSNNPVTKVLMELFFSPMDGDYIKQQSQRISKAAQLGLKDFYPKDNKIFPKMAEDQLLNNAIDIEKQASQFKKLLSSSGAFDINNLSKPLDPKFKVLINDVNNIDLKLKEMGGKRVELASIDTTQSRKEIGKLDIEINNLLKQRKDKVRPFGDIEDSITELNRYVKAQEDAINNSNLPLAAKKVLQRNLEPLKSLYSDMKSYFNAQGINQLAKPLEDVWDRVVNKLKDVESLLNKLTLKQKLAFNTVQSNIYRTATSPIDLSVDLQKAGLDDLKVQKINLEKALVETKKALKDIQAIANVGDTSERKSRIEELKKTINDQTQQVSDLTLSIEKTTYEIKNNFQKEDSLRAASKAIRDFNLAVQNQSLQITRQYRDWQYQIDDAVYNNQMQIRQLSESYSDLMFNLQNQLEVASNELLNVRVQIGSEKRKQENLLISPGTDSIARQVNSIFNQLFDSLTNGEQEKRQANLDAAQVQKQYIDTLRQIRQVEEDGKNARKAQVKSIESLKDRFTDLGLSIKQIVTQLNEQQQELIRNQKREGRNVAPYLSQVSIPEYNQRVPFSVPMGKPIVNQPVQPTIVISPVEPVKVQAEIVRVKNPEIPIKITPKTDDQNWKKIIGDQLPPKTQPQVNNTAKPNIIQQGITAIGNTLNAINPFYTAPAQAANIPTQAWEGNLARLLNQYGSQMTVEDFKRASAKSGISIDALVTQAFIESHFGTKGRGRFTKNPLNYGNDDAGNNKHFKSFGDGLEYAAIKLKKDFFFSTPEDFVARDFKGRYGRYATDPAYGSKYMRALSRMRGLLYNQMRSAAPQEWLVADASEGISNMGSAIYQTNATAQARAKQIEANKKRQREIDKQKLGSLTENWGTIIEFWKQKYPESYNPEIMSKFGNKFIDTRPDSTNKVQPLTKPLKIDASPAMLEKVGITKQIKESTKKAITEGVTEGFNDAVKMPDLQKQLQQVTNPKDLGIAGVPYLTPIAVNSFESAKKLADKQREVNTELAKTKSLVADEKMTTSYLEAIDNLTRLEYTLKEANLAKTRSLFDGQEELRQITRNAKGYQTAQEQNQKVGYDIWKSFEDKRRAIQDANFAEELKQKGWTVQKQKLIEDLQAKGINPAYDEQVKTSLNNLDIQMNQSKVLQQQLTIQNQQIDTLATQTVQTAMARDNEDRRLNAMKEYGDLQANLASTRYNYGGELINNGAVISAQLNALQSLATAKRKVETEQFSPQQAKQYLAMTKELADVNIKQSYVDAIPFLKEFSSSLKDVVLQTTNWRDALKKLLDLAASTILDQLVIKPMQNGIANLANDWGLFGNTNPINPPSNAVGIDNGNNFSGNIINASESISTISKVVPEVTQSFSALALSNAQNQVTEQTALMAFSASLQTATLAVMQFSAGLGGQSIMSGLIGQSVTDAASGGYTGILDIPSLFYNGSDCVPNYADGVESALTKERAMSGRKPYLAALHEGEAVLSTLNGDSALYRSLKRSGTWDELKTGDQIPNFAKGTDGGMSQGSRSQSNRQGDRGGAAYTINVNQTIVTPNASSFNSSERQRNQDLMVRINKSVGR